MACKWSPQEPFAWNIKHYFLRKIKKKKKKKKYFKKSAEMITQHTTEASEDVW